MCIENLEDEIKDIENGKYDTGLDYVGSYSIKEEFISLLENTPIHVHMNCDEYFSCHQVTSIDPSLNNIVNAPPIIIHDININHHNDFISNQTSNLSKNVNPNSVNVKHYYSTNNYIPG